MSASINEILEVPGAQLSVTVWEPDIAPRATLQVVHGMAEHMGRYDHVAQAFCAAGIVVFGHDQRGHGRTADASQRGHMGHWSHVTDDVRHVGEAINSRYPDLPAVLLGHSMGSFIAQQMLIESPRHAEAWILSGSNGRPPLIAGLGRIVARIERWRCGPDRPSKIFQKFATGQFNKQFEGRTASDWLSRDQTLVDAYIADETCGFPISSESWEGLLGSLVWISKPSRQRMIPPQVPIYIASGSEDPVSAKAAGVRRLESAYRAAGLQDVTLQIYPGARHEIFNETNREEVFADLIEWCRMRLAI